MRPVLLEMDGFASFREPTTVDFRDAEYFALVGPTGAGKSTVIDALTFALYGSVPRWDDRRAVSLALAPTAGRGAVRFVFDVGGARYVVARELRRAAKGGVSVRTARLERLGDPAGTGAPEETTEPLADGAGATTAAVEQLLGLPFADFTTCVVLPQGEFAEFLHAEPRKRQEKLVRLLGLGLYDTIAKEANAEAARQRSRADLLAEQLGGFADATAEAEAAAAARVAELEALGERVRVAAGELANADAELAAVRADYARLSGERARLTALAAPDGLDALAERRRTATGAAAAAADRTATAEAADTAARDALAAAPARAPLERARRAHAERAALAAEAPGAAERHAKARAAYATAEADAAAARATLDAARAGAGAATAALGAARDTASRLAAEAGALAAVAVPAGLDELGERQAAADAAAARAADALAVADAAEQAARAALAAAPDREPLVQARRDHRDLAAARAERETALDRRTAADAAVAAAAAEVERARAHVEHARAERERALRAGLAADLRATLAPGEPCPVCAQEVAEPPAPLPVPDPVDPAGAEAALERARSGAARAGSDRARAVEALERADAEVARLGRAVRVAAAALPAGGAAEGDPSGAAAVDAALAELDRLGAAADHAASAARAARRAHDAAVRDAAAVRGEAAALATALRAARDPLVPLGAPAPDDDVVAAWTALVGWAQRAAAERGAAVDAARAAVAAAEADDRTATAALAAAREAERRRAADAVDAARADTDARAAVERIDARLAELAGELAGAPSDADAAAALDDLAARETAARAADTALRAARTAQRAADADVAAVARDVEAAGQALRSARDPVVALGAPVPGGDDPAADWAQLVAWASAAAAERDTALGTVQERGRTVRAERDARVARVVDDLTAHALDLPVADGPDALAAALAGSAPEAVAVAAARARADRERIAERRAAAADLAAARDAAAEDAQVAKLLGGLLRSDGFPRWLVASALDALVADASRSLAELSGGQFELTHADGEFVVVDHADADARRPVKTLSGGETFQASLALALALSSQMSALAAEGAARLESIVLDEGFGTLDEANLEVVASTLENLAARGDRVVGVITHVAALAERVPVRFTVHRDQRSSRVERTG
jgi:exonuclease SbcC